MESTGRPRSRPADLAGTEGKDELALPLPILLWNNRGYGEIKRYMAESTISEIGVDIYTPDFLTFARGFGCRAERAETLEQLRQQLRHARRGQP